MSNKRLMPVFEAAGRAVSESAKRSEAQRSAACYSQNNEVSRSKRGPMPVLEAAWRIALLCYSQNNGFCNVVVFIFVSH
jgi:hypothetical protein